MQNLLKFFSTFFITNKTIYLTDKKAFPMDIRKEKDNLFEA